MTTAKEALTRAFEEVATPRRHSIIDALRSDATCTGCHRLGGQPRQWDTPHGRARGWFCDDCEVAVDVARRHLRAGLVTKSAQVLERAAS